MVPFAALPRYLLYRGNYCTLSENFTMEGTDNTEFRIYCFLLRVLHGPVIFAAVIMNYVYLQDENDGIFFLGLPRP